MASPSEKLAESLEALRALQQDGVIAVRSDHLSRTHRERLLKNGFLQQVMKGWYVPARPDEQKGKSTAWYASFWGFCAAYLNGRFNASRCASRAERSLLSRCEVFAAMPACSKKRDSQCGNPSRSSSAS